MRLFLLWHFTLTPFSLYPLHPVKIAFILQCSGELQDERYPHMRARKRFGRIAIANSDAGASAMFESAIEQAHRAATELT